MAKKRETLARIFIAYSIVLFTATVSMVFVPQIENGIRWWIVGAGLIGAVVLGIAAVVATPLKDK